MQTRNGDSLRTRFCDMTITVKRGRYFREVMNFPAVATHLNIVLMMCWMSIILHGVNVDRLMKRPYRTSRFSRRDRDI